MYEKREKKIWAKDYMVGFRTIEFNACRSIGFKMNWYVQTRIYDPQSLFLFCSRYNERLGTIPSVHSPRIRFFFLFAHGNLEKIK